MLTTNEAPFTHGMEIEQMRSRLPSGTTDRTGTLPDWERDMSGPHETAIGAYKNAKTILDRFYAGTRDERGSWEWHAAGSDGSGCGSHVHICLAEDVFEDDVEAWTISYNTAVELAPFLAPFFCHDWEAGFRSGARYSSSRLAIDRWAEPQLTRLSTDSIRDRVRNSSRYSRGFDSVTFNPAEGEKPVTVEIRMNDAHPGVALTGALYARRVAGRAVEGGWSPKLESRDMRRRAYELIYEEAVDRGLFAAMATEERFAFRDGRGIPGVDRLEFDSMLEVLKAIIRAYPQTPHSWSYRVQRLVTQGRDDYAPARNRYALWRLDNPEGQFHWDAGPDVR